MRKILSAALGVSLVGVLAVTTVQASAGTTAVASGSVVDFAAVTQVGAHPAITQAIAVSVAQHFSVITDQGTRFTPYLAAMRAANHNLVVLSYINADYQNQGHGFPASAYLYDAHHRQVFSRNYHNYLMNPTDPGWVSNRVKGCTQLIAASKYDGCDLDNLGTSAVDPGYVDALPINPATHKVFTKSQWLAATDHLASMIKKAAGSHIIIGNGLGSGSRFFGGSQVLLNGEDGGICEGFIRSGGDPIGLIPNEATWKQNVDMLVSAAKANKRIIAITKTWGGGSAAQIAAMHQFTLASFLLGNDGRSTFAFFASPKSLSTQADPWAGFAIGSPKGSYAKVGGVYQRSFSSGLVLVNPTSATAHVSLGGTYVDVNGHAMTSATLAPHTALILRK